MSLYVNRLKIKNITHSRDRMDIFLFIESRKGSWKLVEHLVENDVDTLHEEFIWILFACYFLSRSGRNRWTNVNIIFDHIIKE